MSQKSELQTFISQPDFTVDSLKKIAAEKGLQIKDWNDRLLITYPNRDHQSSQRVNYNDSFVRQCRGVILTKEPLNIVCYAMDKLYRSSEFTDAQLQEYFNEADWVVDELIDGSLVKLYWFDSQWNIATNRCIEAKKARWTNYRSFYELFQEAAGNLDYTKLDKRCTYSFVLCHPENRIVTNHQSPKIVLVSIRNLDTMSEVPLTGATGVAPELGVSVPLSLKMDWETLQDRLQTNPYYMPGYVLHTQDGKRIIFEGVHYLKVKELKGNHQDLIFRYLQLQRENESSQFQDFITYFPEYKWIDSQLEMLAREAHKTYIDFFVKRLKSRINRDLWELMSELHTLFLRTQEPTSLPKVRQHLKSYPLDKLTRLMKMKTQ